MVMASPTDTCSASSARPRAIAIDVAAIDEVADFRKRQQHRQHDGTGIDRACRPVVCAAAQEMAAHSEGGGGNAVAVKEPVEDRRRADVWPDDAWLPGDARHDQPRDRGSEHP